MLKLSNETKVGVFAVLAIVLGIWGFKFLQGINLLTTSQTFYVRYDNIDELKQSNPVYLNGFQVGTVKLIYQDPEDNRKLVVELNLERGVSLPKDTRAQIAGAGLMGGKVIRLMFDKPCTDDCAPSGTWLKGENLGFLESMVGPPQALDEYSTRLQTGMRGVLNDPQGLGKTMTELQGTLAGITALSLQLNRMMLANAANLQTSTSGLAQLTTALGQSSDNIKNTMANLDALTGQLKNADLGVPAKKMGSTLDSVSASLSTLRGTLAHTTAALGHVDSLAQKLNTGQGTLGKFFTDPMLYENLNRTTRQLQFLLQDLRLNPKRYTTVKLKIFGSNKTKGYVDPLDDPIYQMHVDSLEKAYEQKTKH